VRHIHIIGIGTGNPEHVTIQAINRMNAADMIFLPTKGARRKASLGAPRDLRSLHHQCADDDRGVAVPVRKTSDRSYVGSVDEWHAALAETYVQLINGLPENGVGAFLVWGDPSLYDSVIRIVERAKAARNRGFRFQCRAWHYQHPGAGGEPPHTDQHGRETRRDHHRAPSGENGNRADSTIVMLDGEQAFSKIDDPDAEIFWGAYLGTEDEIVIAGRLADVADDIVKDAGGGEGAAWLDHGHLPAAQGARLRRSVKQTCILIRPPVSM
jgi:precorrin-6A synthase